MNSLEILSLFCLNGGLVLAIVFVRMVDMAIFSSWNGSCQGFSKRLPALPIKIKLSPPYNPILQDNLFVWATRYFLMHHKSEKGDDNKTLFNS